MSYTINETYHYHLGVGNDETLEGLAHYITANHIPADSELSIEDNAVVFTLTPEEVTQGEFEAYSEGIIE